jgi:ribonuclease HI
MIFTNSDGGARGNPGKGAIGVIIRDGEKILFQHSEKIGDFVTNNIAEYEALIRALELAGRITKDELVCFMDSELVVRQLLGDYKVKNPNILPLFLKVQRLQENFSKITYRHVSREDKFQKIVDGLLNEELDKK